VITIRRSSERGHTQLPWLESRHTFSFGDYYDPPHMGFRSLRVLNEDRVAPGRGFAPHAHRDAEIVSWVLSGALAHRDSLGNGSVIRAGEVQRMTAGTGVTHSEFNPSDTEPVHFFQIWFEPARRALPPSYEQRHVDLGCHPDGLRLVASGAPRDGAVRVHQDVDLYAASLRGDVPLAFDLRAGRAAWLHVVRGTVTVAGDNSLSTGDAAALSDVPTLQMRATTDAEILLFDVA